MANIIDMVCITTRIDENLHDLLSAVRREMHRQTKMVRACILQLLVPRPCTAKAQSRDVWLPAESMVARMFPFILAARHALIRLLGKRLGRRTLMPRWLAVLLHIAWMTLTAPLFFGPIEEAFALSTWRMW